MSDPFDPFVLQTYSRRDRAKLERLRDEAAELGPKIEEAYRRQDHRAIHRLETEYERRVRKLEGFVVELQETEHEEPISQEVPLDVHFAELYADYLHGFPGRQEVTLERLLRHVANQYPGFNPSATDEALIAAAEDAYEWHRKHRQNMRRAIPSEIEKTKWSLDILKREKRAKRGGR